MAPPADYYALLGVPRHATPDQLKAAYRRLARELHPDANPENPEAEERFKQVSQAYAVLRDPEKRARYDAYGDAGLGSWAANGDDLFGSIFADFPDLASFFGSVFGGRAQARGPRVFRGDSLRADADLTLDEAFRGVTRDLRVDRQRRCGACDGCGSAGDARPAPCRNCNGTGQVQNIQRGPFGIQMSTVFTCPRCGGEGQTVTDPCRACEGTGRQRSRDRVTVDIPAGIESGSRLIVAGEGDAGPRGGPPGDLVVVVHIRADSRFRRRGTEFITTVALPFTTAALGGRLDIETLDGVTTVDIPAGTQSGTTVRVPGKGMPDPRTGRRGDLHAVLYVAVPRRLTRPQRRLLEEFRAAGGDTVAEDEDARGFFERLREALGRD